MNTENINNIKQRFSIIGNSPALYNAIERAVKVAPIDLSVLIYGESGTGKEFFPKIIHNSGARKHRKYIAVNCGAIPEGTIDSELFGHEKGAFTGAVTTRKGYFEEADGGTIFLDEVAELPLTTQARLLRVLETGEFLKVGSSEVQRTNVRIVAATNVDLQRAVRQGRFREDLYYRLSTVIIDVPPLRDRGDDIFLLARKFASDFSEKYLTAPITFSEEARHAMSLYSWPGNVRQLKNIVEQLALFDAGKEISRGDLLESLPTPDRRGAEGRNVPYADHHSYEQEREMLWQSLFSLRGEIAALKDLLASAGIVPQDGGGVHGRVGSQTLLSHLAPRNAKAEDLLSPLPENADNVAGEADVDPAEDPAGVPEGVTLEDAERRAVADALSRANGDKKVAAARLNISPRTLYRKIREYGLD
ncbi:MAG: sigma-54 dependent transcriptional regulator [Muribaculaceae bacterium]|nr:sigma-54 dependent transcriptional regulator [Muribaculaceae bacterium]